VLEGHTKLVVDERADVEGDRNKNNEEREGKGGSKRIHVGGAYQGSTN